MSRPWSALTSSRIVNTCICFCAHMHIYHRIFVCEVLTAMLFIISIEYYFFCVYLQWFCGSLPSLTDVFYYYLSSSSLLLCVCIYMCTMQTMAHMCRPEDEFQEPVLSGWNFGFWGSNSSHHACTASFFTC